jgi:phage-related protein
VKFAEFVYVLHCVQKKSKRGAKTPVRDLELIRSRLRMAEADYTARRETE